jgi:cytochrome oxidase Cu insertion factor (SCO1/SenC/PrrC family)
MKTTTRLAVALSLALAIPAGARQQPPAAAPDPHAGHEGMHHPVPVPVPAPAPQAAPEANAAQSYFGEIPLVDQDGKTHQLYSDLIEGKVVVIDFMFTSCTGACPIMSNNFAKIQDWLGDRLGKDVYLLSVSVDPANDTPAKMKEYAARYKARPGWYFLTGSQENVDAALRKLGNYVENPEAHQNLFLIGNDKTGLWKKAFGLAEPTALIPVVQSVLEDKG